MNLGNKILIIGCAGSGKTTLAKKLHATLNLPLIHMDRYYWQANWGSIADEEWEKKILSLCAQDAWIMDGNYTKTLKQRLAHATSVVYLDTPRWRCLLRALLRRFRFFHNKKRDDIPKECQERINLSLYSWIWNYPKRSKPVTLAMIAEFKGPSYHLKTNKDIACFLRGVTGFKKTG